MERKSYHGTLAVICNHVADPSVSCGALCASNSTRAAVHAVHVRNLPMVVNIALQAGENPSQTLAALTNKVQWLIKHGSLVSQLVLNSSTGQVHGELQKALKMLTIAAVSSPTLAPHSLRLSGDRPDVVLAKMNPVNLTALVITNFAKESISNLSIYLSSFINLRSLSLTRIYSGDPDVQLSETFVSSLTAMTNLRQLKLGVKLDAGLFAQLPSTLTALAVKFLPPGASLLQMVGNLYKLKLTSPMCSAEELEAVCTLPGLTDVKLVYSPDVAVTARSHAAVWGEISALHSLKIDFTNRPSSDDYVITDDITAGVTACTELTELDLQAPTYDSTMKLTTMLEPLTKLQELAVVVTEAATDLDTFGALAEGVLQGLASLHLQWPQAGLLALMQIYQCRHQQHLQVSTQTVGGGWFHVDAWSEVKRSVYIAPDALHHSF